MIDKNLLRVSVKGELKWLHREELEAYVDALSPVGDATEGASEANTITVDGVKAVVAAGCQRRRLSELMEAGLFYVPPENINPIDRITIMSEQSARECRLQINDFLNGVDMQTVTTPLSVTQLLWMRRQKSEMSAVLLEHGCALQFGQRHMTVYASSPQLLRVCQHRLLQLLIDFVDCKIKHPMYDKSCELVLQAAHQSGCFAVWHDGVLEVQGDRASVHSIITTAPSTTLSPCKLINVHPHADKDFICGKKDGKLLRIMREMSVQIDLKDAVGDMLLQITTTGPCFEKAWRASRQVDDELPTVKTAHIPEFQHRRLIGQAGKNIQKIMKRHAVYIKFFGHEEAREEFGGSGEWHMPPNLFANFNVVIKTPSKNVGACEDSYADILAQCSLAAPPGKVKLAIEVAVGDVLKVAVDRDQVVAFVDGQWKVLCFGASQVIKSRGDPIPTVSCEAPKQQKDNSAKMELFSLFPSAFLPSSIEPFHPEKTIIEPFHLQTATIEPIPADRRLSVLEDGDEKIQTTDQSIPAVGVIGDHKQDHKELDSIDDVIDAMMRNLRQAHFGRRKSLTVFEL